MRRIGIYCAVIAAAAALTACGKKPAAETSAAAAVESTAAEEKEAEDAQEEKADDADSEKDAEEAAGDTLFQAVKNSYEIQEIPKEILLPAAPVVWDYVSAAYESVTYEMLQGAWTCTYKEGKDEITEILSVNGERGKIESFTNGMRNEAWNGEGWFSIIDRTAQNVCPAITIDDESGSNICTIYVRWVKDDAFYDGGFLREWKRVDAEDFDYLYDTVAMENLEGVWYSEYEKGADIYRDVLTIEDGRSTLFRTVNDEPDPFWNHKGSAELHMTEYRPGKIFPELLIHDEEKDNGTAGIYISNVTEDNFFDQGFMRYWYRIPENIGALLNGESSSEYDGEYDIEVDDGSIPEGYASYEGDTWVKHAAQHVFRVTPVGSTAEDGMTNLWKLEITNNEGGRLDLDLEIDPMSNYLPDISDIVFEEDVNFDGRPDLLVFEAMFGAQSVEYDRCYLNQGNKYVEVEGYNEIGNMISMPQNKHLVSTVRDGAARYYEDIFEIRGTELVHVSQTIFEDKDDGRGYVEVSHTEF